MALNLRPLGWMATIIFSVGTLFVSYFNRALALTLLLAFVVAGAAALVLLALLDIMARRDFETRQHIAWASIVIFGIPPLGAVVYLFLGRQKTSGAFRRADDPPPTRRIHPSAYRVGNPFRRP